MCIQIGKNLLGGYNYPCVPIKNGKGNCRTINGRMAKQKGTKLEWGAHILGRGEPNRLLKA